MKYAIAAGLTLMSLPAFSKPTASVEGGAFGIQNHQIRLSSTGSSFDYKNDGGQDNLYPFYRFLVTYPISQDSRLEFLYQPLEISTRVTLKKDTVFDEQVFAANSALDTRYSFPFYRVSYFTEGNLFGIPLSYGAGLQIRNATIEFSSADGALRRTRSDIGPVPLLTARWQSSQQETYYSIKLATMYAAVKYLNGSDSEVVGAFTDAALGFHHSLEENRSFFFKFRYLGGGARGESSEQSNQFGDAFTSNWIDALSFSIGLKGEV